MSLSITSAVAAPAQALLNRKLGVSKADLAIVAASSVLPLIQPALLSLRGGGDVTTAKGKAVPVRGGGASEAKQSKSNTGLFQLSPEGKSVLCMATGMAIHYLGYSFARSITVALFTSASTGYPGTPGAFPFAMAFVSPVSLVLLMGYASMLKVLGPKGALRGTTLGCAAMIILSAVALELSQGRGLELLGIPATKFISGPLFVFRESYVQLLTSQYWSFIASVMTPNESSKWFAPIAGLTSIASAFGGVSVSKLTSKIGLSGTLACTGFVLSLSLFFTDAAYAIAESNGFDPHSVKAKGVKVNKKAESEEKPSMLATAKSIFKRVPILRALFWEILASQGLATLLNVCFVQSIGASITDDNERAGWVGHFYALINVISMVLQFGVLPLLMQYIEPKALWRFIPLTSLAFTTFQAFQKMPSLYIVSASLLIMKVLEYSARRMLDEMVYVPLDFESRFVGKEIIGVFGYRFGKSLMSLSLSGLTSAFGHFNLQQLSIICDLAALAWAKTAWDLSSLVPTQKEAQDEYMTSHKKEKRD